MAASTRSPARTILLVGAAGQVGSNLLRALRPLGRVVPTVRAPSQVLALSDALPLDVMDAAAIRDVVRRVEPDWIVNATAYTAVDRAESDAAAARSVNAVAPGVLAAEAQRRGALLVHFSTDYVFDGSGDRPWREADPTGPVNEYGRTKLAGEEAIRATGARHWIVRTSWVYGLSGSNFVKTMLRLGRDRSELRVVADQHGAPTSASVIAVTTSQMLAQAVAGGPDYFDRHGGTWHLASGGETSWHGLAEETFRLARQARIALAVERVVPITSAEYPTPARRPLNSRLDCGRLRAQFGLLPAPWQTTLAEEFPAILRECGLET